MTAYDAEGYLLANQLNIYNVNDRTKLIMPADSSINIYLEHKKNEPARQLNWMPIPKGKFNLLWRIWPKPSGEWQAPRVRKVE